MKRVVAILLILCLATSICACNTSEVEQSSNVVELNADNIDQYLGMKKYEPDDGSMKIEFYALQGGSFAKTQITIFFDKLYPAYIYSITGAEFKSEDEYAREGTITFSLPADGRYEIEIHFWDWYGYGKNMIFELSDATGTFTPVK